MSRKTPIYEGKAKVLYEGTEPGTIIQYFKDDATAFNAQKRGTIAGKGVLNNMITEFVMTRLAEIGIPTHFIRRLNMREQLCRKCEIVPIEVVVRNIVAGSMAKRLGLEFYYKDDDLGDLLVSDEHILALGWASAEELEEIVGMTLRVNDYLCGLMRGIGIKLVDFKLEFGRVWEGDFAHLVLADEFSPDNCRLCVLPESAEIEMLNKDK